MPVEPRLTIHGDSGSAVRASNEAREALAKLRAEASAGSKTITASARDVVAAQVKEREAIKRQAAAFREVAASAAKGSREQVTAARLATEAEKKLAGAYATTAHEQTRLARAHAGGRSELDKATRGALAGSGAFRSLGRSIAFASATFLGTAGFVKVVSDSITGASDLREQIEKTNDVFRASGPQVNAWSKGLATSFGIAQREALAFTSTFGNMLVPMGVAPTKAADMSKHLVELSADVAAFNNLPIAEVLEKMRAGLAGMPRPLRTVGVFLDQTRIKAEAVADGFVKATADGQKIADAETRLSIAHAKLTATQAKYGAGTTQVASATVALHTAQAALEKAVAGNVPPLDAQAKAMAAYQIIVKDTAIQQGNFRKTSGDLAQQQKILHAEVGNLEDELGAQLLPTVTRVTTAVTAWLGKSENQERIQRDLHQATQAVTAAIKELWPEVQKAARFANDVAQGFGGWNNMIKLYLGYKVASKVLAEEGALRKLSGALGGLSKSPWKINLQLIGGVAIGLLLAKLQKQLDALTGGDKRAGRVAIGGGGRVTVDPVTGKFYGGDKGVQIPIPESVAAKELGVSIKRLHEMVAKALRDSAATVDQAAVAAGRFPLGREAGRRSTLTPGTAALLSDLGGTGMLSGSVSTSTTGGHHAGYNDNWRSYHYHGQALDLKPDAAIWTTLYNAMMGDGSNIVELYGPFGLWKRTAPGATPVQLSPQQNPKLWADHQNHIHVSYIGGVAEAAAITGAPQSATGTGAAPTPRGGRQPAASSAAGPALSSAQQEIARTVYGLAIKAGLSPAQAIEVVAAAYAETGGTLDPKSRNPKSGAAGLFQLLTRGYVEKANKLGGVYDPIANTLAILAEYVKFFRSHPLAKPGAAGASVEASGEGPGFYSKGIGLFQYLAGTDPLVVGKAAKRARTKQSDVIPQRLQAALAEAQLASVSAVLDVLREEKKYLEGARSKAKKGSKRRTEIDQALKGVDDEIDGILKNRADALKAHRKKLSEEFKRQQEAAGPGRPALIRAGARGDRGDIGALDVAANRGVIDQIGATQAAIAKKARAEHKKMMDGIQKDLQAALKQSDKMWNTVGDILQRALERAKKIAAAKAKDLAAALTFATPVGAELAKLPGATQLTVGSDLFGRPLEISVARAKDRVAELVQVVKTGSAKARAAAIEELSKIADGVGAALDAATAKAQAALDAATQRFQQMFERVSARVLGAFDRDTQRGIDQMNKDSQARIDVLAKAAQSSIETLTSANQAQVKIMQDELKKHLDAVSAATDVAISQLQARADARIKQIQDRFSAAIQAAQIGGQALTPAEKALQDLQEQHDAAQRAVELAAAQKELADAKQTGDPERIKAAQDALNEILYQEKIRQLQKEADAERKALDDETAAKVKALEDQQAAAEKQVQDELTARQRAIQDEAAARTAALQQEESDREEALGRLLQDQVDAINAELATRTQTIQDETTAQIQGYQDERDAQRALLEDQLADWEAHLANREADWQSFIDWLSGTTGQFSDLGEGTGGAFAKAFLDALTAAGLDLGTLFGLANSGLPPFDKPGRSKGSATGWQGFQGGGIVPGPRGRPRIVVAHGHEAILTDRHQRMLARQLYGRAPTVDPRDLPPMTSGGRAGGGGVTVQVIGGTFLGRDEATGRAIARLVEPHIKRRIIGFTTYNG